MKKLLVLLPCVLVSLNLFALGGLHETGCNQSEVDAMFKIVTDRLSGYLSGTTTDLEAKYALSASLDVKVCAGTITKEKYCTEKLEVLSTIVDQKNQLFDSGMINKKEVDRSKQDLLELQEDCQ